MNPLSSPCLEGRKRHQWRSRKTHGELNLTDHGHYRCKWCGKSFREVREEQERARRRRQPK